MIKIHFLILFSIKIHAVSMCFSTNCARTKQIVKGSKTKGRKLCPSIYFMKVTDSSGINLCGIRLDLNVGKHRWEAEKDGQSSQQADLCLWQCVWTSKKIFTLLK